MFIEHTLNEIKNIWYICEKYIRKNSFFREKLFSNEHILECSALYYSLNGDTGSKVRVDFSKKLLDENAIIPNDSIIITEIKLDTLEKIRLTYEAETKYSMKNMRDNIENQFNNGYPTQVKSPFMCVEVVYNDTNYNITGELREYLYSGNNILSSKFIRMIMFENFGLYIKPDNTFSLHTIDNNVTINEIVFKSNEHNDYVYTL